MHMILNITIQQTHHAKNHKLEQALVEELPRLGLNSGLRLFSFMDSALFLCDTFISI